MIGVNTMWFGHPLGALARLEATLHPQIHNVSGRSAPHHGWARWAPHQPEPGLLVFSPVVTVALAGFGAMRREGWQGDLRWCAMAAAAQFGLYASYSVCGEATRMAPGI